MNWCCRISPLNCSRAGARSAGTHRQRQDLADPPAVPLLRPRSGRHPYGAGWQWQQPVRLAFPAAGAPARQVGMITQNVQLFNASVRDNLTFFDPSMPDEHIWRVIHDLGMQDWFRRLPDGLDTVLESGGSGLSAGRGAAAGADAHLPQRSRAGGAGRGFFAP
jgi:hypothetical protein